MAEKTNKLSNIINRTKTIDVRPFVVNKDLRDFHPRLRKQTRNSLFGIEHEVKSKISRPSSVTGI